MRQLLNNEIIKVFKQTGYKVLICIILALVIIIPVGSFAIEKISASFSNNSSVQDRYDDYMEMTEYDNNDKLEKEYFLAKAGAYKFFIDNDIQDSWKYSYFINSYENSLVALRGYELLAKGEATYMEIEKSSFLWIMRNDFYGDTYYDGYYKEEIVITDEEEKEDEFEKTDWAATYAEKAVQLEAIEKYIVDATTQEILKTSVETYKQTLEQAKDNVALSEIELKAAEATNALASTNETKINVEVAKYKLDLAKSEQTKAEKMLAAYQKLYDIEADLKGWQYNAVTNVYTSSLNMVFSSVPYSETLYEYYYKQDLRYSSYDEYLEKFEKDRKSDTASIAIIEYALENDIAIPEMLSTSTKSEWRSNLSTVLSMISIFVIVMSGMIVANEHTSGTIRLLLIRPKKRGKILLSKVLCILLYTGALTFAAALLLLPLNIIFNGVTDIFTPDLIYTGGKIIKVNSMLMTLGICLLTTITTLLVASVALLFSTLTKKSVLAIAFPLIINMILATIQVFVLVLPSTVSALSFLNYTILPYIDLSIFTVSPIKALYSSSILSSGTGYLYPYISSLNLGYGIVIVLAHIALIVGLTFVSFNRQQIKN